jgi:molybdenum cofactor cytidylyltransferase
VIASVILAAGSGERLGGVAKAVLEAPGGSSFLAQILAAATAGGARRHVVVVGEPHRAAVEAEAERLGVEVAVNPDPARGMGSSVAVGFEHAASRFSGAAAALLWPVDHPRVAPATVRLLVARAHPDAVVVPTFAGRGGHPTLVGRSLWQALAGCGDLPEGARSVLRGREGVVRVPVADEGVVADVDTRADIP